VAGIAVPEQGASLMVTVPESPRHSNSSNLKLGDSIGLFAQGSWILRSLAAILWAESTDLADDLGLAFSQDRDVRVRRALARALANAEHGQDADARDILLHDPRWSVRSILGTTAQPPG
jgi:hypothetical protein